MKRVTRILLVVFAASIMITAPAHVHANTISVSQTITITARVAPARSIIVNDNGRITSVISNTDEAITPLVYKHKMHGQQQDLTLDLLKQYQQIINGRTDLVGIEIPVEPPQATNESVQKVLFNTLSTLLMKF